MASPDRPYVRVYHDDLRRDYAAVYADDAALATWLRLLVVVDKMWPSPAELPRSVKARPLAILTDCGLVTIDGPYFSVRGYQAERTMRQQRARDAAALRWQSGRIADDMPRPRPSPRPSPKDPPNPPKGGRSRNGVDRRAAPEVLGSILKRVSGETS